MNLTLRVSDPGSLGWSQNVHFPNVPGPRTIVREAPLWLLLRLGTFPATDLFVRSFMTQLLSVHWKPGVLPLLWSLVSQPLALFSEAKPLCGRRNHPWGVSPERKRLGRKAFFHPPNTRAPSTLPCPRIPCVLPRGWKKSLNEDKGIRRQLDQKLHQKAAGTTLPRGHC